MDIDQVFNKYAVFGYYQKQIFCCLSGIQIFGAFQNIQNVFIGAEPEFYCVNNGKKSVGCPKSGTCQKYYYPGDDFTSIVSEFDLVCEESYKANMVQSIYMAFLFAGSILFGKMADSYGRKRIGVITLLGMAAFALLGTFSTSYRFYVLCRIISAIFNGGWGLISFVLLTEVIGPSKRSLSGFTYYAVLYRLNSMFCRFYVLCRIMSAIFNGGWILISFVLLTELIGPSKRSLSGTAVPAMFAVGILVYAVLAFYIRNWRVLTCVTALPGAVGIYFMWFLPESPRWLYSRGRISDAEAVLTHIITKNNGYPPKQPIKLQNIAPATQDSSSGKPGMKNGRSDKFLDLMFVPILRAMTLNNMYTWFANCCTYYGLTMGIGNLGGSVYLSVAMSGVVEIPAYVLALYMIDSSLGRKYTYSWTMLLGGAVCVSIILIPTGSSLVRSGAALLGKMAVSVSFSVAWLYSAEMYPTSLRNQGVALCSGSSRVGGMIAPILLQLGTTHPYMDFVSYGVMMFIAGLLALRLPETNKQPMPENVSDLIELRSHNVRITALTDDKVRLLQEEIEGNQSEEV